MKDTFLSQVAYEMQKKGSLSNGCQIVFPQRRAIEVFRSLVDRNPPRMLTMPQLFIDASGIRRADDTEMLFRLYKVYRSVCASRGLNDTMTLDEFVPWSEMMLNDFSDVDKSLADAHSVFRELNNLKDIEEIKFADEEALKSLKKYFSTFCQAYGSDMRGKYHTIWNMLSAIYDGINAENPKTAYEGAIYRAGCRNMLKSQGQKYAFVGFNVLCGAERTVMSFLKSQDRAEFYWDYTPGFVEEGNEAVENISRNVKVYGGWTPRQGTAALSPLHIVESHTQSGEAAYVGKWLKSVSPQKGDYTAVIPMDKGIIGMLRFFLPQKEYGFNLPCPIGRSATYARLMRFSEEELSRHRDGENYKASDYIAALKAKIEKHVPEEGNEEYVVEKASLDAAKTAIDATGNLVEKNAEFIVSSTVAAMIFKKLYTVSDEDVVLNANADGKKRVEVLDLAETRTVDYDNVLMLDCNEGSLPQNRQTPTMLPNIVRSVYGMPSLGNRSGIAAYNFFRILKRTPNVSAVYTSSVSSAGAKEMSRYLLQVVAGEVGRKYDTIRLESRAAVAGYVPQPVKKTRQMLLNLKRLEPTPLYMYVTCPLKFYYNKIAGLRAPDPNAEKMPANLFGTLFHEAIQLYYEEKPSPHIERSTIENDLKDKTRAYINKCIGKAFEICRVPNNSVMRGIIMKYLTDVLEYDAAHTPFDVMPQYIEKYIYAPFVTRNGYDVMVGGKFDRVHVKNGVYAVVDYKTGNSKKPASAKSFDSVLTKFDTQNHYSYVLQTMVYSLALKHKLESDHTPYTAIRPELYFITGMKQKDFDPTVLIDKKNVEDYVAVEKEVAAGIQWLVDDIFDTGKPFAPCEDVKRCEKCDYRKLCNR